MPRTKKTEKEEVKAEETKAQEEKPKKKKTSSKAKAASKPAAKKTTAKKSTAKKSTSKKASTKSSAKKTADKNTSKEAPAKGTAPSKAVENESSANSSENNNSAPEQKVEETAKTIESKTKAAAQNKAKAEAEAKKAAAESEIKVDPNLRYSDEDLAEFEQIIQEQKKDQLDELYMLRERLEDLNSEESAEESMIYSMHMAEQGSEAMEKEKTYAQIQRINEYLKKLDEALVRIKDKTYGICRKCGILIAKERLKAVPITTLSASYKIHQECPEDGIDRIAPKK